MLNRLKSELDSGLPNLRGTRVTGDLPIPQTLINELVASRTPIAGVEFRSANVIVAKVFGISLTATITRVEPPLKVVLRLSLLARVAAMAIKGRLPFLHLEGGEAKVDLSSLPQIMSQPQIWRHVRLLQLRTYPGELVVSFELAVD